MAFNFADVTEAIANAIPEREALVIGERRETFAELEERSRRFANFLLGRGLRVEQERSELAGHESGQAHLALYLYNGPEYLEAMYGAFKARVAPLNVNYRYVEEELLYLFRNSAARALVYHAEFAPGVAALRDQLPQLEILIQVADDSGNALVDGAVDYEEALAGSSPERPDVTPSADDLYILYTGGTTGMPKGVLWRSDDIFVSAMGGTRPDGTEIASIEELSEGLVAAAAGSDGAKVLVGPPLMHGAAQWSSMIAMTMGNGLVFPTNLKQLDPQDFWSTAEREKVVSVTIVGDAFARPLIDELKRGRYDLSGLVVIGSGGAPLSAANKRAFFEHLPHVVIFDGMGSSEAGTQASNISTKDSVSSGNFNPAKGSIVLAEDLSRVLDPSDLSLGWLAKSGRAPLGYLGDAEKTARTFPLIDGVRYSVPGDRAHYREDGGIELLGRDSACINSGGEKIFAEEVEAAVKAHGDVFDALVAPRPSERWGQEVVAVVALRDGATPDEASLLAEAARHIARYKLPKVFVFVDRVQRSPSGKADYRWAKQQAQGAD